ncbi:MAG: branched-chain amino acid ABC transporter permease [Candidatus Bathyarchaeota archaeon]|nr:branched-chain amino acid ABC transporter permease [Candidatus Bathyarchaeota archaeon]
MFDPSGFANALIWGVATGCIYILLAAGLNIIFGVMKLVNFAHGQLLMLGAYIAFAVSTALGLNAYLVSVGLNVYISILVAIAAVALVGVAVERLTFNRVRGREKLTEIFLSLGLISIFQNIVILWQGFDLHQIASPFAGMNVAVGSVSISYDWLFAVGFVIVTLVLLFVLLKKTRIGMAIRATSQKGEAATLMGINIKQVYIFTFLLGAALAGAAGALYGMILPFDTTIGAYPTIKAFAIIILGGFGSLPGAIIGGLLYGIAENSAIYFLGGTWADAIAFVMLIGVLIVRPNGIFGQKEEQ